MGSANGDFKPPWPRGKRTARNPDPGVSAQAFRAGA